MKTLIISYSFTGNNGKLANKIARILDADYTVIKETKNRTLFTILIDLLLNRIPPIKKLEKQFELYTNLIFVAPIWFGKIATPLRALFKELKIALWRVEKLGFTIQLSQEDKRLCISYVQFQSMKDLSKGLMEISGAKIEADENNECK